MKLYEVKKGYNCGWNFSIDGLLQVAVTAVYMSLILRINQIVSPLMLA